MQRLPSAAPSRSLPSIVDELRLDAEEGPRRRAGLEVGRAGQRRDHDAAGLGLPPGVDDRAASVADHVEIPFPGFRVDRLADRAQHPQRFARGLLHMRVAGAHQRADGGRRGVEDVDLVLVDHLPEARRRGIVGHAFEHQRGGAIGERAVDDVAVAGHPADIGRAPVDIAVMVVEDVLVRHRGEDEIAAGGVQHALRLAGRARRVEDEQRVLRLHLLRLAFGLDRGDLLVVPEVAAGRPADLAAGAAHDQHGLHLDAMAGGDLDRLVGILLERDRSCRRAGLHRR